MKLESTSWLLRNIVPRLEHKPQSDRPAECSVFILLLSIIADNLTMSTQSSSDSDMELRYSNKHNSSFSGNEDAKEARKRFRQKARNMRGGALRAATTTCPDEKQEHRQSPRRTKSADYGYRNLFGELNLSPRKGKRPNSRCPSSTHVGTFTTRPTLKRARSHPNFSSNSQRPTILASFVSFRQSEQSLRSKTENVPPRKPPRRMSNDQAGQSDPPLIEAFQSFNNSQLTLCSQTESVAPRKPSRRMSGDSSARSDLPLIKAFESFNNSQKSLCSKTEIHSPRKPARQMSTMKSMPVLELFERVQTEKELEAPRKPTQSLARDMSVPLIQAFDSFNDSQRSLCSKTEIKSPRKPARRMSTDHYTALIQAFDSKDEPQSTRVVTSPRKPGRRMSRDLSVPCLLSPTLQDESEKDATSRIDKQSLKSSLALSRTVSPDNFESVLELDGPSESFTRDDSAPPLQASVSFYALQHGLQSKV